VKWIFALFLLINKASDYFGYRILRNKLKLVAYSVLLLVMPYVPWKMILENMLVRGIVTCLFFFTTRMQDLLIF
jgi:uncharacterized membrane protein